MLAYGEGAVEAAVRRMVRRGGPEVAVRRGRSAAWRWRSCRCPVVALAWGGESAGGGLLRTDRASSPWWPNGVGASRWSVALRLGCGCRLAYGCLVATAGCQSSGAALAGVPKSDLVEAVA